MRLNDVAFPSRPPIDGYAPGGFRIGGYAHPGGLLILPERIGDWDYDAPLTAAAFERVIAAADQLDLLLIGMGAEIAPMPAAARAALEAAGVAP